ncbi:MAG: hypothetical protein JWQ62_2194, partial [Lacunisphaera sp.]|nr:hypothetical protein [Lacunisphaera sp.]
MDSLRSSIPNRVLGVLGLVALASAAFILPVMPTLSLDASWQMALGKFFVNGNRFGTEVVFTYGPLGWTMGNMYWGPQWGALLLWHGLLALVMAALVWRVACRLPVSRRVLFLLFFFLFGLKYEDVQQQAAIAILGLELIRRADRDWHWTSTASLGLMAVFSLVKFTNLVLVVALVFFAGVRALGRRRWPSALLAPGWFAGLLLLGWMLCGQHLGDLPAYFVNSWEISSGYQDAMGWSCPAPQLYLGLAVAAVLLGYLGVNAWTDEDRPRGVSLALAAASYLFLNWKHGFIRADGHQLVFYFAALMMAVGSPFLLGDARRSYWTKQILLAVAALLSLRGAELATPGLMRGAIATVTGKAQRQFALALHPGAIRVEYDDALDATRREVPLPLTRAVVGDRSVDVLGFEQDVALLNQLNFSPRPVFQSYSAYTPRLARLNRDYFDSDRAPGFVLLKLQAVDHRLETMDDALVLNLLPSRYSYLFTERGLSVWQRKPHPTEAIHPPAPIRTVKTRIGEPVDLADLRGKNVWVQIEYKLNLLGRLRRFLFKPPLVQLRLTDETGASSSYRLPQPVGATGFLVSPLIHDVADFLRAANDASGRHAVSLAVEPAAQDRDCFQGEVTVVVATVPTLPGAGWPALPLGTPEAPLNFVRGHAPFGAQLSQVDGKLEYYAHAPASLVYRAPGGAGILQGSFGIYDGAYAPENKSPTDGVEFLVRWRNPDGREEILFRRLLRPREVEADRKLQTFQAPVPRGTGELEFVTSPGP